MEINKSLQIIDQIVAAYAGTREQRKLVEQSWQAIINTAQVGERALLEKQAQKKTVEAKAVEKSMLNGKKAVKPAQVTT